MLDKISWNVFEKTGDIDAYLLYSDFKKISGVEEIETETNTQSKSNNIG